MDKEPDKTPKEIVKQLAFELGFDLVGVCEAEKFQAHRSVVLQRMQDGLMEDLPWYSPARVIRGTDPLTLLPEARSIISLAMSYNISENVRLDVSKGRVARYAWGDDYHKVMKTRMKEFVSQLSQNIQTEVLGRWYVDDGPMLDRAVAQKAGLGWFGKNTNILSSEFGSWIFLGQVLTDLELEPDEPVKKNCGSCVKCITSCPTGAIVAPYVIDNKRCISHLTIENRGAIPKKFRSYMSDWVFGCDICQDVCPVNVSALYSSEQAFKKKRFTTLELLDILSLTESEFQQRFLRSPIKRAKLEGLKRNACVALGNSRDNSAVSSLVKILQHETPLVRAHAAWALGEIGGAQALSALRHTMLVDEEDMVLAEASAAIDLLDQ